MKITSLLFFKVIFFIALVLSCGHDRNQIENNLNFNSQNSIQQKPFITSPRLKLSDLLIVDFLEGNGYVARPISLEEINNIENRILESFGEDDQVAYDDCANESGHKSLVYGPKVSNGFPWSRYDNQLYVLPDGHSTPEKWDCDGFYIPKDRSLLFLSNVHIGPLAAKITDIQWAKLTTIDENKGILKIDSGIVIQIKHKGEVNWWIPEELSQRSIENPPGGIILPVP